MVPPGAAPDVQLLQPIRSRLAGDVAASPVPEPVTVTVARMVRPDRRPAFERWADDVLQRAARFPGNLGATLLRPGPGSSEYHLVYRFADDESLAAWERSPERRRALVELESMVDEERYARFSGLESFFTRPARPGPRWRLTLLTIAVVFAITSLLHLLVTPHLSGWPVPLRLLLSATVVVLVLGHVAMPVATRVLARWLRPPGN